MFPASCWRCANSTAVASVSLIALRRPSNCCSACSCRMLFSFRLPILKSRRLLAAWFSLAEPQLLSSAAESRGDRKTPAQLPFQCLSRRAPIGKPGVSGEDRILQQPASTRSPCAIPISSNVACNSRLFSNAICTAASALKVRRSRARIAPRICSLASTSFCHSTCFPVRCQWSIADHRSTARAMPKNENSDSIQRRKKARLIFVPVLS